MAKETKDIEVIIDEGDVVSLSTGTQVLIQPLKSRQFFKLLRIVTHGAGGLLMNMNFSGDDSPEQFAAKLLAIVGYAIPDAEDEVIDFLNSMVKPANEKTGKSLSRADKAENQDLIDSLHAELYNPELEDLITLVEAIVSREAADLQALGKRLMAMFDLARKTGQIPEQPATPVVTDSEE